MSNALNLGKLANNLNTDGRLSSTGCSGIVGLSSGGTNTALTTTAGQVIYGNGSTFASTSTGSSGQVLISQGSSNPYWGNLAAATTTQLSSGMFMMGFSSITISALMLTSYKFVYIYFVNLNCMMSYGLTIGSASVTTQSNASSSMGMIMLDLVNNACSATSMRASGSGAAFMTGSHNVNQFSTSITISCSPTTFTSGNYVLYGQP